MANEQNQDHNHSHDQGKMQIKADDSLLKGAYANAAQIAHTQEEVVIDFFLLRPPVGQLTSRVVMSPGHAKRLASALAQNIKNYEKHHGEIKSAPVPNANEEGATTGEVGFEAA